jgi:hypothetical protein
MGARGVLRYERRSVKQRREDPLQRFVVLYNSSVSASEQMAKATPEETKAGMDAWMAWAARAGEAIVDLGSPIQATAHISADGKGDNSSQASGYSLLQADSRDEIDALLENHPHLKMPGASIDVFEALAMPGS